MAYPSILVNTGHEVMDGTPHQLFNISNPIVKHFQIFIYLDPASTGSENLSATLEVMRYIDSVYHVIETQTAVGNQVKRVIEFNYRSAKGVKVTLTQTGGTMRDLQWEVHSI